MHDETLTRLEAMLVSLRDQLDALTDRVESSLAEQNRALSRLRIDLARVTGGSVSVRPEARQQREPVER